MAWLTSWYLYDLLTIFLVILSTVYVFFKYKYRHWAKRNVPVVEAPTFPLGHFSRMFTSRSTDLILADMYQKGKGHPYVGAYLFANPVLIPRDLEIIKSILIRDFSTFQDRGLEIDAERDPLAGHLFLLSGQKWRNLRVTLTPTFTSGKMKMMFPTLVDVGKKLQVLLKEESSNSESDIKDIMSRYTTDVIASVAFGIEANSLKNPKVIFRTLINKMLQMSLRQIRLIPQEINDFFINLVQETMDYREQNNVKRNDFFQLLFQLKTIGYVKDADHHDIPQEEKQKFTVEQAAAQAFLFFVAGFETSSSTLQYLLYELALNQDLQKQLQDEIDSIQDLSYENLMELDLLDRVIAEALRKYPVAPILMRVCGKEYQVPGTDLTLYPKDAINISVYGIHHDPELYPDPEKFDPDRFLPEVKAARHPCAYIPFGDGPRSCIGNRFALMTMKTGLALLLAQFNVSPSKRTPIPLVFDLRFGVSRPKDPIYLKMTPRF